jgi:SpoVK/Ycf46/Vps4 family AAA+-type ATPase
MSDDGFVRYQQLTDDGVDWSDRWNRIYVDPVLKEKVVNNGLVEATLGDVDQMTLSRHSTVLLYGPPGTGKTSLARGAGHVLSERLPLSDLGLEHVSFKQIEVKDLLSSDHGDTPDLVQAAFDRIKQGAKQGHTFQVVLLDEVESLFSNRAMLGDTDPMDAIRAVNTALDNLDALAELDNVYVIATSNEPDVVDRAFLDRTDEQLYVGPPDPDHRAQIIDDVLADLRESVGLELTLEGPQRARLVELSDGFSGRTLRKTFLSTVTRDERFVLNPAALTVEDVAAEFEHRQRQARDGDGQHTTARGRDGEVVGDV